MRIAIHSDDLKLKLHLPSAILKSKFFWSKVTKENGINKMRAKVIGKELIKYARKHGHFTLIEIKDDDTEITVAV